MHAISYNIKCYYYCVIIIIVPSSDATIPVFSMPSSGLHLIVTIDVSLVGIHSTLIIAKFFVNVVSLNIFS